jgi:hypothetical protein
MKKLLSLTSALLFTFAVSAQNANKYQKYLGDYSVENAPFEKVIISMQDGSFWGEAVGQGNSELLDTDVANTFELESITGAKVVFSAEKGIINSIELIMDQGTITGKRQFPSISDYEGVYNFPAGSPVSSMTVKDMSGEMGIETSEFGKSTVAKTSKIDIFFEPNYQSDFIFQRNDEGIVTGINIVVASQGISIEGVKEMPEKEMSLDFYVGTYDFSDMGFSIHVENRDGRMYVFSDQGEGFMEPTDDTHTFKADAMDVSVAFKVNDSNEITEMVLNYQGQAMTGKPKK